MRYAFGDYTLDTDRYELRRAGTLVKLRPKVFELLAYLIAHRERLVAKQELLEQLWPALSIGEATLNSCIRAARQAVGDTGQAQRVIQTRHGRGFRFVAEIAVHRQELVESARPPSPARPSPLVLQDSPVAGGPVWGPEDQEQVAPERPTAAGVDAEHKAVTVLCAGVGEATALAAQLGPEAMYRLMQACLATAQQVLPPYGGTLTHITGEGFVALFGAPLAQEDHARRAVLAAVALQQALQASTAGVSPRVPLAIGVHTGPVVVGGLDAKSQRLYTAVGETLTLASRLRQRAAPGAILLSATTQQLVQAEMQVDDGGTLGVAEEAAPMPVYQVRGIVRRRSGVLGRGGRALSRFVGRERELAMLHERLQHATQGQGQVLGLAGEPGIGKSRLLYEFRQSLGERPVTYCEGHCLAYGERHAVSAGTGPAAPALWHRRDRWPRGHHQESPRPPARGGHDARGRGAIPPAGPGPDGRGRPTGPAQSPGDPGTDVCHPAAGLPGQQSTASPHPGSGEPALDRSHLGGVADGAGGAHGRGGDPPAGDLPARLSPRLAGAVLCDAARLATADR